MVVKSEDLDLRRLTLEFGHQVLVVNCKPENDIKVAAMLAGISSKTHNVYEALAKVSGPVESYHIESVNFNKT